MWYHYGSKGERFPRDVGDVMSSKIREGEVGWGETVGPTRREGIRQREVE